MRTYLNLVLMVFLIAGCQSKKLTGFTNQYSSETLIIQPLTSHVYQHITFLQTESFGRVSCNGMIVVDGQEAVVFDTTPDSTTSEELIRWVENTLKCRIKAVIPTHFHADCLGGLNAFHARNIPSYANQATIHLATAHQSAVPKNGFNNRLELKVGKSAVVAEFFGEGHTKDNVVGYFPDEKVIFGGCLIKELGADKGNLADATVETWPETVAALKKKYPDTEIVIPGHGKAGGTQLLDYTINLFK